MMYFFIMLVRQLPSLSCAFVVRDFCASLQRHELNVIMTSFAFFLHVIVLSLDFQVLQCRW